MRKKKTIISFVQREAVGPYAENQKIIAVRKVYQKGIMTPMISVELLWKDYCSFEMNVNPTLGKTMIESRSRDFSNAKRLTKEFESLTRPIDRNNPCLPPNVPLTSEEIKQLSAWRKFITWERSNPLKTEDKLLLTRRIQLAYEQSLLCFGYHVDLWFEICSYLEQTSRFYAEHGDIHMSKRFLDDTAHFYERAIQTFMRSNMLIHFAYADFEEARLNIDKARAIYNHLLDRKEAVHLTDPTLAYIQAMQFERRVDGIKSARAVFKRAREDSRINYQVYVAAALMEYYCTKDQKIACNIFNLGLKKYPQHVDYILAYVDYMTHLNEDQNARVLFDGLLAQEQGISNESQVPIWTEFLKFESQLGDLASIKNVEQRRADLFVKFNQLDGRQTALLIDRYRFLDLCPCSTDDLKLLGLQTQSDPIIESSSSSTIKDRRDSLPKPDIKHMMPYRPTRNPLPGSHPTPGGVFPLPDTALYLVKVLPPTRNFEVESLIDLPKTNEFLAFPRDLL